MSERLSTKSNQRPRGIYSSESRECGCEIRRYVGGSVIIVGCKDHPNHTEYVCPICGKKQSKKQLIECRWSHAI